MANNATRFFLEYYAYLVANALINLLPRKAAFALGRLLGLLSLKLMKKRVNLAEDNLRRAFPEKSSPEIGTLLREHFMHLGVSAIEMLRLTRLQPGMPVEAEVQVIGEEHLKEAFALNKGVIFLSAHLGFWEIASVHIPNLGYPLDFVARKLKNPRLDVLLQETRSKHGCRFIDRRRGARKIVKALAQNRMVGILLDQHATPSEATRVNFFNRPCWATPIVTQIAMKRGIPVVPTFVTRTRSDDYILEIQAPLILAGNSDDPEQLRINTQLLTDIIESAIRKNIPQWFWVHQRWRSMRPDPE
ncbi:MAG: lysophospholipid acyltransferase family protein [Desulfuromonadales bacterium]|nr:lysophospholipid acyltransferase family protein [Desulfuromonadales bacterium]